MRSPTPTSTPTSTPTRGGAGANIALALLAGLMLVLSVPVLLESSPGALGRLGLLAALVVLPLSLLLLVQRRAGGPSVPGVSSPER